MDVLKKYKYATIILAVLVIVLLVVLIMKDKKADPVMEAQTALASCQNDIEGWNAKYASTTTSKKQISAVAKQELSNILTKCTKDAHQTAAAL
jgi:outer membrane lipoprotein-sorting protein